MAGGWILVKRTVLLVCSRYKGPGQDNYFSLPLRQNDMIVPLLFSLTIIDSVVVAYVKTPVSKSNVPSITNNTKSLGKIPSSTAPEAHLTVSTVPLGSSTHPTPTNVSIIFPRLVASCSYKSLMCYQPTLPTCSDNLANISNILEFSSSNYTSAQDRFLCRFTYFRFHFDVFKERNYLLTHINYLRLLRFHPHLEVNMYCEIANSERCDQFSTCLYDECGCENSTVFNCADGNGCVMLGNVCNGKYDCSDGSDECLCENSVKCQYHGADYSTQQICIVPDRLCTVPPSNLQDMNCEGLGNVTQFLESCETSTVKDAVDKCFSQFHSSDNISDIISDSIVPNSTLKKSNTKKLQSNYT